MRICDALQQNREQVAQAYFEIWTTEVGTGMKNNSSVNFEIFWGGIPWGDFKPNSQLTGGSVRFQAAATV